MQDFYRRFYERVPTSPAYRRLCELSLGGDLGQHGFADLAQIDDLIEALRPRAGHRVLDLGCGTGQISERVAVRTGAAVTGVDLSPLAIAAAKARTADRPALEFVCADLNTLRPEPASLDAVMAIDSLYFADDLPDLAARLLTALRPGGRMSFLHSHGRLPWIPEDEFDRSTLDPQRTPVGAALVAAGADPVATDLTAEDVRLAELRLEVLRALHDDFATEDLLDVWDNRRAEADGTLRAARAGLHRRYRLDAQRR
ncbi:methyltransferase domain-containing protein [Actinotalea sp. M2MS4P-6]|nr:methyltransferase domain-containing protein [Actinotalea sp. M2MS4P-6]